MVYHNFVSWTFFVTDTWCTATLSSHSHTGAGSEPSMILIRLVFAARSGAWNYRKHYHSPLATQ